MSESFSLTETPLWSCRNCGHKYPADDVTYPLLPEHLTTTNTPPLQQELVDLKDVLDTADTQVVRDLSALDVEIASLQYTLAVLQARRAKMETHMLACKSIVSPLRRLPAEIILEIMDWATCVSTETNTVEREAVPWCLTGIWVYSQVCQRWRAIALSTPAFWSKLSIHLDMIICENPDSKLVRPTVDHLETTLSRSANHLLSFEFCLDDDDDSVVAIAHQLLQSLVKHSERWYEASLTLPLASLEQLHSVQNHIPNLESLTLEVPEDGDVYIGGIQYFQNAPALRKVEFDISDMPSPNIPWSQITECSVLSRVDAILSNLRTMDDLTSLVLHWQHPDRDRFLCGPLPMELGNLRRLEVFASEDLVSAITLPALQELKVHIAELEPVIALIQRSGCRITGVDFFPNDWSNTVDPVTLLKFLRVLPSVAVVDLSGEPAGNIVQIFKFLVSPEEHGHLLPLLTKLILPSEILQPPVDCDTDPIDADRTIPIDLVIQFLRQRRDPQFISPTTRGIESVVFLGLEDPPLGLSPELQSLERDGVRICLNRRRWGMDPMAACSLHVNCNIKLSNH